MDLNHTNMDRLEQVKNIADQLIGQGNLNIVDSAFSADYIAHSGEKTHNGHKFIKQFAKQLRTAIPASNKKVKWHEIVVSRFDKDKIIEEWVVSDLAFQLMLKLKDYIYL